MNPVSGKKRAHKNLALTESVLSDRGVPYRVHRTCAVHDAEAIARRLTQEGEEKLVVLGGDGTLHEVLNGLNDPAACSLGLIPSGTGNDFAEKLGIPLQAEEAARRIVDGEAKPVDYLEVGGVRCMNVAGIGMDVDVLERCQRGKLKGKLKYFMSLLSSFFVFQGYPVVIHRDGKGEKHHALLAAACNGSQFGGGIPICPAAQIDDGLMNVLVVDHIRGKWNLVKALMALMKGKIPEYRTSTHFLCDRIRFEPQVPCTVQLDGELYKGLDLDVKLCKGLKMYR